MKVPILDLKAQYESIKEEIEPKVREIFSTGSFILGPEVEGLEKEVASYSSVLLSIGISSGSDALLVSLMALQIGEGDGVVTTPFTFFATGGAIARLRARPVFCDIDEKSFNISPIILKELLAAEKKGRGGAKIKAIIPVHLYGQCADMDPIMDLAKKYDLFVIEDSAQSIGAEYPSKSGVKKAGSMGTCGTLSFYPTKNLGGAGDGGMVLTNDQALADRVRRMRTHGETKRYYYDFVGGNFRLDALQASILRIKLRHLDTWQSKRRANAHYYDEQFAAKGLVKEGLVRCPETIYRKPGVTMDHTYHQYVIRAKNRDKLREFLKERGVATSVFYPLPLHLQNCFSYLGYKKGDLPVSERMSEEVLALPIYPELTREQQDWVVSSISDFYKK